MVKWILVRIVYFKFISNFKKMIEKLVENLTNIWTITLPHVGEA